MLYLTFLLIGLLLGYLYRTLRDFIKEFKTSIKEKPEVGVNLGEYGQVKGYSNQNSDIGLVNSKTPQQLEFEAKQREQLYGYDSKR